MSGCNDRSGCPAIAVARGLLGSIRQGGEICQ